MPPKALKSCAPCAKLKARCDRKRDERRCQRCIRLDKECLDQPSGSHRGRFSDRRDAIRTSTANRQLLSTTDSTQEGVSAADGPFVIPPPLPQVVIPSPQDHRPNLPESQHNGHNGSVALTADSKNGRLEIYRTHMMPLFPFVIIKARTTENSLRENSPVLYLAVMSVTSHPENDVQDSFSQQCHDAIGDKLWIEGEKSLDVLQAILVFVAWRHAHFKFRTQVTTMIHMAASILVELGIHKEVPKHDTRHLGLLRGVSKPPIKQPVKTMTFKQRRCQLGVYWLSSIFGACRGDVLGFSAQTYDSIAKSCQLLSSPKPEFPTDNHLIRLVQLQQEADYLDETLHREHTWAPSGLGSDTNLFRYLEKRVGEIRNTENDVGSHGHLLNLSLFTARLGLYKIGLTDALFDSGSEECLAYHRWAAADLTLQRSIILKSCFDTCLSMIDCFLLLEDDVALSMPFPHWMQVGHSIYIFSRLLWVDAEFWNPQEEFKRQRLELRFEEVSRKIERISNRDARNPCTRSLPEIFQGWRQIISVIIKKGAGGETDNNGNPTQEPLLFLGNSVPQSLGQLDVEMGMPGGGSYLDTEWLMNSDFQMLFDAQWSSL